MSLLKLSIKGKVAEIKLNRPDKKNALNPQLVRELQNCFNSLRSKAISIVSLSGEGDVFSAGADLAHIQQLAKNSDEENRNDSRELMTLFKSIYDFPKTVIAKVNGHAIAGGAGLASVCDIVLMKKSAKIGYTEIKIGFVAAIVMVFLRRMIPEKNAKELLLSGRLISASEAKDIGLINHIFEDDSFDLQADNYIQNILNNSPLALAETKSLFHRISELPIEQALEDAAHSNVKARKSADCKEGIAAFLEKRKAIWT